MDPFIAEIRMFGCNFAPRGWAQCNGQLISIAQNTALFSLLGTTYGGNGQTTFGLPNLQGSAANHMGQGPGLSPYVEGQKSGTSSVTLLANQLAVHNHTAIGDDGDGTTPNPSGGAWATPGADRGINYYDNSASTVAMNPGALSSNGGNQPHNNLMPYQVQNFCIAMQGIFPSRN